MYTIYQDIANDMAKTVPMKYSQMKSLFLMKEEDADHYELKLWNKIEKEYSHNVAKVVVAFFPLYLESEAITKYINKTKNYSLRNLMPEILTAEEMILIARGDVSTLEPQEEQTIIKLLKETMIRFSKENKALKEKQSKSSQRMQIAKATVLLQMMADAKGISLEEFIEQIRQKQAKLNSQQNSNESPESKSSESRI